MKQLKEIEAFANNFYEFQKNMNEDEKLIKNDILQLLLTSPGERVMRPDFGTEVRRFVFEGITQDSIDGLKESILNAIATFEPRLTATTVEIQTKLDENYVNIKVYGNFNIDRFFNVAESSQTVQTGLLVEFGLSMNKLGQNTGLVATS